MNTETIILSAFLSATIIAILLYFSHKKESINITIETRENPENFKYTAGIDPYEEEIVKPKRKYKKRVSKKKLMVAEPIVKKPIGRPRKITK